MTISDNIIKWLMTFEESYIDTDFLKSNSRAYGLFKLPQQNIKPDILGNIKVTAYYTFRLRFDSKSDTERKKNQSYLESLTNWVLTQNREKNFPSVENCEEVSISTPFSVETTENDTAIYQLTISIRYTKGA